MISGIWEPETYFKDLGQFFITYVLTLPLKNATVIALLGIKVVSLQIFDELHYIR